MRCVVSSFGSAGDLLPSLAVGAALRRRGHEVQLVANPFYASRARHAGLPLVPAGDRFDVFAAIERQPAYADAARAARLLRDFVAPDTAAVYPVVGDLLRSAEVDVVVANDVAFGALWAAAERGVPSVLVHATPALWVSGRAPLVFADSRLAALLVRPLSAVAPRVLAFVMTRFLRQLGRRVGVKLADVSFTASLGTAALRLGLWSPLLRGRVAGDPANGVICGFARASALGGEAAGLPAEIDSFLDGGPAPVVVGFGSAFSLVAGPILIAIAEACVELDRRCLVVGHPAGAKFPSNTLAVPYAPYDRVFPRAAAVVVHAGAGTTGEALRCGKPVIGVPFAFDQFTLCAAIAALGAGVRVPLAARSARDFTAIVRRVLADEALRARASESGRRFSAEADGAETAADAIEDLVARREMRGDRESPGRRGSSP